MATQFLTELKRGFFGAKISIDSGFVLIFNNKMRTNKKKYLTHDIVVEGLYLFADIEMSPSSPLSCSLFFAFLV